jgi:hypothetical protein
LSSDFKSCNAPPADCGNSASSANIKNFPSRATVNSNCIEDATLGCRRISAADVGASGLNAQRNEGGT